MEEIYDIKGYEEIYGITKNGIVYSYPKLKARHKNGYEIKRTLGYDNSTIAKRCKDHKKAYNYYWRYANEERRN